jgi:hypothetical protein
MTRKKTRKQSVLPAVDFTFNSPDGREEDSERDFTVDVVNHGLGPAVFVQVLWSHKNKIGDGWCLLLNKPGTSTLGAGQSISLRFRTPWMAPSYRRPDSTPFEGGGGLHLLGVLSVRYQDVHERTGCTERQIWISNEHGPTNVEFQDDDTTKNVIPGFKPLELEV